MVGKIGITLILHLRKQVLRSSRENEKYCTLSVLSSHGSLATGQELQIGSPGSMSQVREEKHKTVFFL